MPKIRVKRVVIDNELRERIAELEAEVILGREATRVEQDEVARLNKAVSALARERDDTKRVCSDALNCEDRLSADLDRAHRALVALALGTAVRT